MQTNPEVSSLNEQVGYQDKLSFYDPNMCFTAPRMSPLPSSYYRNRPQESNNDTYGNEHFSRQHKSQRHFGVIDNNYSQSQSLHSFEHIYQNYHNDKATTSVNCEPLILNRPTNGNSHHEIYQHYTQQSNSQLIQFTANVNEQTTAPERHDNVIYEHQCCDGQQIPTSTHLLQLNRDPPRSSSNNSQILSEQDENYLESGNVMGIQHERNRQRSLLESTMSPLLAAVNEAAAEFLFENNNSYNYRTSYYPAEEFSEYENLKNKTKKARKKTKRHLAKQRTTEIGSGDDGELIEYLVVADRPIDSRARASLPTDYLRFTKNTKNYEEPVICAKCDIPKMTKFGPIEGDLQSVDVMSDLIKMKRPKMYPLLMIGKSKLLDVSNENNSNWMRYVQMATTLDEQNLLLFEENDRLYFKSSRIIVPKEVLRIGYSITYAHFHSLELLDNNFRERSDKTWPTNVYNNGSTNIGNIYNENGLLIRKNEKFSNNSTKMSLRKRRDIKIQNSFYENQPEDFSQDSATRKIRIKFRKSEFKMVCPICNRLLKSEEESKKHETHHTNRNQKAHNCPHCSRNCSTSAALMAHINSHKKEKHFTCILCPAKFTKINEFRQHIPQHSVNDLYYCCFCKKKYLKYRLVRKHIKIFHQSKSSYECSDCDRKFLHHSFLKRHKLIHSEQRDFPCPKCEKKFKRKDKLKEHSARIHSNQPNINTLVKKRKEQNKLKFPSLQRNGKNKNREHKARLKLSNKKDIIGRNSTKSNLGFGNFPYKCIKCEVGFKRRGILVNHMTKIHPNENIDNLDELKIPILKPKLVFDCLYCKKCYASNAKRKAHIIKYHPNEKLPSKENINTKQIGCIESEIFPCESCYKQYSSKNKLLLHHRKNHFIENIPKKDTISDNDNKVIEKNHFTNDKMHEKNLENGLLQLSSALEFFEI